MTELIHREQFADLFLREYPLLDVRSEVEFEQNHFPASTNQPILINSEREQVGTCYKEQGREAALSLGHQLVSGATKEKRVQDWCDFLKQSEHSALTCFRGGLRSQIAQAWCSEKNLHRPRIAGGTKALRQFLLETLAEKVSHHQFMVISGRTGSGKTAWLRQQEKHKAVLDLEKAAEHRGSAFGLIGERQPSQASFENRLAICLLKISEQFPAAQNILIEDESRMLGSLVIPENLFLKIRQAPLLLLEEPLESRVEQIFQEYVLETALSKRDIRAGNQVIDRFEIAVKKISRKLGSERTQQILTILQSCRQDYLDGRGPHRHREWIEKLLIWYYDPLYTRSFERRKPEVFVRGSKKTLTPA